ncbi:adenylate/guanylate cyclase domain-containing protein [Haloechinothrix halophila]|uniref:adenylate/guanylate cyclase domain-containing protein n=1 Tax=Haloechinothrix halophila TaxID=1069073 RepID=UPI000556383B|nr:adenylate/guanylate cyclase domain-containing protein [Haloechinothrix halophila]
MPDAESSPSGELAEPILGEPRRYSGRTAARLAGISLDRAHRYWRSFGYATLDDDAVEFTDSDVAVLRMMVGYVDEGILAERDALQLSRLSGHAIARLVQTQVEVVLGRLERIGGATTTRDYFHALAHRVFPDVQLLLGNAWRRHIAASISHIDPAADSGPTVDLTVGFADLVGYTELSKRLSDTELTSLIDDFEDTAIAIITERGGTVVKTVGDEVLFVANTPDVAADIAADLSTTFHEHPTTPPLRIGLATGPVVRHLGDVFGTTVNLASRLTALAAPDSVLVSPAVAATLTDDTRFTLSRLDEVHIRGIGPLTPWHWHATRPS